MHRVLRKGALLLLLCAACGTPAYAAKETAQISIEARLERLERVLASQGLVDIMLKLDSLQTEVQRLRGEIEVQNHGLEELKKRQRDLYVDLDRRLLQLERRSPLASTPPADMGGTPAPAGAGAAVGAATAPTAQAPQVPVVRKPAQGLRPGVARNGAKPAPVSHSEQQAYQHAFDQLRELRYDKASVSFRAFLKQYPDGRYAHIAQYWLGEASYVQRKYKEAINDYQTLIKVYPGSPKLAEAMLKIGYSEYELKNDKAAEQSLGRLLQTYPGTTEASQGQNLLQKIKLRRGK